MNALEAVDSASTEEEKAAAEAELATVKETLDTQLVASWTSAADEIFDITQTYLVASKTYVLVEEESPKNYQTAAPLYFTTAEMNNSVVISGVYSSIDSDGTGVPARITALVKILLRFLK